MAHLASIDYLRKLRDTTPATFRALILVYCGSLLSIQGSAAAVLTGMSGWGIGSLFVALTGITFLAQGLWQLRNYEPSRPSRYGGIEYALAGFAGIITITFFGFVLLLP